MGYKTIVFRGSGDKVDDVSKKFDSKVNQAIQEGYEPVGGVSMKVTSRPCSPFYFCEFAQAVIKK